MANCEATIATLSVQPSSTICPQFWALVCMHNHLEGLIKRISHETTSLYREGFESSSPEVRVLNRAWNVMYRSAKTAVRAASIAGEKELEDWERQKVQG